MYRWDARYRQIASKQSISVADWETRLVEITNADVSSPPIVESENFAAIDLLPANSAPKSIEIVSTRPEQWIFRVVTEQAGLLTVKSYQDGNWQAILRSLDMKNAS